MKSLRPIVIDINQMSAIKTTCFQFHTFYFTEF